MDENKNAVVPSPEPQVDRNEKVQNFKLEFTIDDIPDVPVTVPEADTPESPSAEPAEASQTTQTTPAVVSMAAAAKAEPPKAKPPKKKRRRMSRALKAAIYSLSIIIVSVVLSIFAIVVLRDMMGMTGTEEQVEIEIPQRATTEQIAQILEDKGIIDNAFVFRVFSRLTKADGKYQPGSFVLSGDMGYSDIIEQLQQMSPRKTVKVTIPEGKTVEEIAAILEKNEVCTSEEFFDAVVNGQFDYDFVKAIPVAADGGRIYRLEGYLFPDTYEFYVNSTGETVVGKMLANFDSKLTQDIRKQIADRGWTIDQAVIMASLVEGEAAKPEDMMMVSRVLKNRLENTEDYPKLQLCSTRDYINNIFPSVPGVAEPTSIAYNTYERKGLPVGAINNPGLQALKAALNPAGDEVMASSWDSRRGKAITVSIAECYFFATAYDTGITYYARNLNDHNAVCDVYNVYDAGSF